MNKKINIIKLGVLLIAFVFASIISLKNNVQPIQARSYSYYMRKTRYRLMTVYTKKNITIRRVYWKRGAVGRPSGYRKRIRVKRGTRLRVVAYPRHWFYWVIAAPRKFWNCVYPTPATNWFTLTRPHRTRRTHQVIDLFKNAPERFDRKHNVYINYGINMTFPKKMIISANGHYFIGFSTQITNHTNKTINLGNYIKRHTMIMQNDVGIQISNKFYSNNYYEPDFDMNNKEANIKIGKSAFNVMFPTNEQDNFDRNLLPGTKAEVWFGFVPKENLYECKQKTGVKILEENSAIDYKAI